MKGIEIPEVTGRSQFFDTDDEQVLAAAVDPSALILFRQKPDVAVVGRRREVAEKVDLQGSRFGRQNGLAPGGVKQVVELQGARHGLEAHT